MEKIRPYVKKCILPVVLTAAAVLVLELFLFNFRHWQFIFNKPVAIDNFGSSDNVSFIDFNAISIDNLDSAPYIEVTGLDMPVNSAYFDFINLDKGEFGVIEINYHLELTDQGNAVPYSVPQRTFFRWVTKSHYTTLNPYGNLHSIRLYFDNVNEGDTIRICSFMLNPKYMLLVSKKRMLALFIILLILYIIRPGSSLYRIKTCERFRGKVIIIIGLLLAEILLMHSAIHLNKWFENVPEGSHTQFMQLTEAIADRGEVFLLAKAPEGMAEMEDPYDAVLRRRLYGEESDIGDMSDVGFYKGRYFVYFGIAPILLFYVPFYMITGTHIATRTVLFILCSWNAAAVLFLLYEICKRYFKELPFIMYLMSSVLFSFGAGQLFLTIVPDFYAVPIIFALACILTGIGFWIKALNAMDEHGNVEKAENVGNTENPDNPGKITSVIVLACLVAGSLFMALTAASRPQFLMASFLAIPLFFAAVFKDRTLFSIKSIGKTIAFVLPYILVAAGVMYYNYIRFNNVFDFGANYNLCYNNMPYRGVHIDRFFHATVGYLFYPCTVTNKFPFFELSSYNSRYMGITADETLFGGIIYNNLYLAIVFFAYKLKKIVDKKEAFIISVLGPVFGIIIAVVDANMAGVLPRYYADFTWGFMIAAFLLFGYLYVSGGVDKSDALISEDVREYRISHTQAVIRRVFFVLFIVTAVRLFLMMFNGDAIHNNNPMAYNVVKNLVEFWY